MRGLGLIAVGVYVCEGSNLVISAWKRSSEVKVLTVLKYTMHSFLLSLVVSSLTSMCYNGREFSNANLVLW